MTNNIIPGHIRFLGIKFWDIYINDIYLYNITLEDLSPVNGNAPQVI